MLQAEDRCDSRDCDAQAYVRVQFCYLGVTPEGNPLVLDFCAHHYTKHKDSLVDQGFELVLDNRNMLSREFALS